MSGHVADEGSAQAAVSSTSFTHSAWVGRQETQAVARLAAQFLEHLNEPSVRADITAQSHASGSRSQAVQEIVAANLHAVGFASEAKGLFADYPVSGLRPDYYKPVGDSGIIFEVERGKTLRNNMDLLDLWKCHLCRTAHHLWLMVPVVVINQRGAVRERPYQAVVKRLSTFFTPSTQVDVRSVTVMGY
jgi:hypothetical protein